MKKQILALMILLLAGISFSSSEATIKKIKTSEKYNSQEARSTRIEGRVKEDLDECQYASMNEPSAEYRAYGSASDEDYDFARHQAILSAKAALVDRLETSVINVIENYRASTTSNGKKTNEDLVKQEIRSIAARVLQNCRVICSNRYRLSDGNYESTVCISIPAATAEKVVGAAVMSDDERNGVEFRSEQFRDSYRDDIERFRKQMEEDK